jgi:hypothetical protein
MKTYAILVRSPYLHNASVDERDADNTLLSGFQAKFIILSLCKIGMTTQEP